MTACAHRWLTAAGERRDTCGECGVFATEVVATLTQRLAAAEGERDTYRALWEDEKEVYARAVEIENELRADLQRVRGALELLAKTLPHEWCRAVVKGQLAALTGPATGEGTR